MTTRTALWTLVLALAGRPGPARAGPGPSADALLRQAAVDEQLHHFEEAYARYMAVVALNPTGPNARFAAESAILVANELAYREAVAAPRVTGTARQALTPGEEALVRACDQWIALYPTDPKAGTIAYKAAYLAFNRNLYPEAAARFRIAIASDPSSQEAAQAATMILDAYTYTEDWPALIDWTDWLLAQPGLGSPEYRAAAARRRSTASFLLWQTAPSP